jgi:glutamyl-tRNA synthetase
MSVLQSTNATTTVSRLAPSPTGALHLGNARSFLIAWLSARSQGGRVLLRIEDIDSPRVKPESIRQIFDDFQWLGFDWDEGPYVQTERLPRYEAALDELKRRELVYPCTCTRSDIERAASAPHLEHEGPIYPGTCRNRSAADAHSLGSRSFAWRVRTTAAPLTWDDGFRGPQALDVGGDFVVWKSATPVSRPTPAYQLAVVVDDAAMGVNEAVRGDDLVPSTPRQLLLYQLFGWTPPRFYHVPLVVGADGRRLAKRHGDTRVSTLRAGGLSAEALLGWLAWSCGWVPAGARIGIRELIRLFRWDTIPQMPVTLDAGPFGS